MSSPDNNPDADNRWRQVTLWCDDWQTAEQTAATHLAPQLTCAEHAEVIASWWFIRKNASWRVRYLPAPGQDEQARTLIEHTMQQLVADDAIQRWAATIYEPEVHAFGGVDGISVAHNLFHADSRHLLDHLRHTRGNHRQELGLVLGSVLMRAAGQDWYEQGDIWARVATHRAHIGRPLQSERPTNQAATKAVGRLITALTDTAHSPLAAAPEWPAAFQRAGHNLGRLADHGHLTRGLRAVLSHHILFAWNRAGVPAPRQAFLATTAAQIIFGSEPADTQPDMRP